VIRDEWISALGIRADEPGRRGGRKGGSNEGKWESREAGDL